MSRTIARNGDDCSERIDEVESQVPAVQEQWRYSYAHCRVCFRETEGSSRCHGSRYSCSGWSDLPVPSWTEPFHDLTDGTDGGCTYQWRVECRHNRWSIFNDTTEPNPSISQPNETQRITTTTSPNRTSHSTLRRNETEDVSELGREMDDLQKEIQLVAVKLGKFATFYLHALISVHVAKNFERLSGTFLRCMMFYAKRFQPG